MERKGTRRIPEQRRARTRRLAHIHAGAATTTAGASGKLGAAGIAGIVCLAAIVLHRLYVFSWQSALQRSVVCWRLFVKQSNRRAHRVTCRWYAVNRCRRNGPSVHSLMNRGFARLCRRSTPPKPKHLLPRWRHHNDLRVMPTLSAQQVRQPLRASRLPHPAFGMV